jgi:hypothetical protein
VPLLGTSVHYPPQAYAATYYLKFPFRRWSSGIDPLVSLNSRV